MPRDDDFSAGPYDLSAPPQWESFPGLYPPLYTQTPDIFFDWVAPFLPEIELRVLLYLIRRTLGFKKQGDQITIEQICNGIVTREGVRLDWGAQLGERSVQRALAGLEAKSLIERHRQLDPERGWRPSYIRLRLCNQSRQDWQSRVRNGQTAPGVGKDTREVSAQTPGRRTAGHQGGVGESTSVPQGGRVRRDTYKKTISQQTNPQETDTLSIPQETGYGASPGTRPVWDQIKEELEAILAPSVFSTRVAGTLQADLSSDVLTIRCPDTQTSLWLEHRLGRTISGIAESLLPEPPTIRFVADR